MESSSAAATQTEPEKVEYTIARLEVPEEEDAGPIWQDVATVRLPKRSHTRTILFAGLREIGVTPAQAREAKLRFRVLDPETAAGHTLKVREPRAPEFELA